MSDELSVRHIVEHEMDIAKITAQKVQERMNDMFHYISLSFMRYLPDDKKTQLAEEFSQQNAIFLICIGEDDLHEIKRSTCCMEIFYQKLLDAFTEFYAEHHGTVPRN